MDLDLEGDFLDDIAFDDKTEDGIDDSGDEIDDGTNTDDDCTGTDKSADDDIKDDNDDSFDDASRRSSEDSGKELCCIESDPRSDACSKADMITDGDSS